MLHLLETFKQLLYQIASNLVANEPLTFPKFQQSNAIIIVYFVRVRIFVNIFIYSAGFHIKLTLS